MKKKVGLIWANPYNENLGVSALGFSALFLLYDIFDENNIDVEFTFIGTNKKDEDCLYFKNKLIKFQNFPVSDFINFKFLIKFIFFGKKINKKKLLNLDYIFDIGEGDSFSDIYGEKRFKLILNSKLFFNFFKVKQILLPQTIGPFENKIFEKKAVKIMNKMKLVIARDKLSKEYCEKILNNENLIDSIDLAFYLPFQNEKIENNKINVGINVSGLLWNGGYTKNNQFGLKDNYQDLIISLVELFLSIQNVQIILIPHVLPQDYPIEDDMIVSIEIQKKYPSTKVSPRFNTPIEAKSFISGLDFFAGSRMHSCIAAFSSNVPVFPIAYSRKFKGLFVDTLSYKYIGDCTNETNNEIIKKIKFTFDSRNKIVDEINTILLNKVTPEFDLLKSKIKEIIKS